METLNLTFQFENTIKTPALTVSLKNVDNPINNTNNNHANTVTDLHICYQIIETDIKYATEPPFGSVLIIQRLEKQKRNENIGMENQNKQHPSSFSKIGWESTITVWDDTTDETKGGEDLIDNKFETVVDEGDYVHGYNLLNGSSFQIKSITNTRFLFMYLSFV